MYDWKYEVLEEGIEVSWDKDYDEETIALIICQASRHYIFSYYSRVHSTRPYLEVANSASSAIKGESDVGHYSEDDDDMMPSVLMLIRKNS